MSDNHQRNFSEEDKRIIIQNYEKIYKYHKLKDKELDKAIKNAEKSNASNHFRRTKTNS